MLKIGAFSSNNRLFLAPMAGVTDLPFRRLCKRFGAGWVVSEMVWSHLHLYDSQKTKKRIDHSDEIEPRIIQIAGGDPNMLAQAAKFNRDKGAQIIDINMGCPAKKVCNKAAGSALMKDEKLVADILCAVVDAVDIPVTLKIRTGWHSEHKNALTIARIAEAEGIAALAIHGRTRDQKYQGHAEYDTIAEIKQNLSIPVIANGDIDNPEKAKFVLEYTKADGLMIGRSAHGNPWIFEAIDTYLQTGTCPPRPQFEDKKLVIVEHLNELHHFYGDYLGIRIARKHIGWYFDYFNIDKAQKQAFYRLNDTALQQRFLQDLQVLF
ncbi:MAG: tRNA dihydrouridine synthase DusB [Francisellaceae bacterium]